jgi:hypothetical protein
MAQQQQNITVSAPGFQGLNTEDSPLQQDPSFCLVADNAVVDRFGRIGARKAWAEYVTEINVTFTPEPTMDTFEDETHRIGQAIVGSPTTFSTVLATMTRTQYDAGRNVLKVDYYLVELNDLGNGEFSLDELTLPTTGITNKATLVDAQFISFDRYLYILSEDNDMMRWSGFTLASHSEITNSTLIYPDTSGNSIQIRPTVGVGAYGRMWITGINDDYQRIWYSDILDAKEWFNGGGGGAVNPLSTAGGINVAEFWPNGRDEIVALAAHNGFLYVFGRQSILIYEGLSGDPADAGGATLRDTVSNIGCVSRDCVTNIGSDVLFVDDTGVRSMGRTIQEKSATIGDLTYNVRQDVITAIRGTANLSNISLSYWPSDNLAILLFAQTGIAYVMEMRAPSQSGGYKMTRWTDCSFNRSISIETNGFGGVLLASNKDSKGVTKYSDYYQYDAQPYEFAYQSNSFTFGQPANLKFLKQLDFTVVSANSPTTAYAQWGYGDLLSNSKQLNITATPAALYSVSTFGNATFGSGPTTTRRYKVNARGSGESCLIGIRADIAGNSFSLQEINVQTLLGRII